MTATDELQGQRFLTAYRGEMTPARNTFRELHPGRALPPCLQVNKPLSTLDPINKPLSTPRAVDKPLSTPTVATITGWVLTTPEQCRSLNAVRDWRQRHADTQRWEHAIRAALTFRAPTTPPAHATVSITRHYAARQRAFDFDDFVGGQKGLLDSLKRLGWIEDDGPAHLQVAYTQEHSTRSQTVIRWEASRE